MAGSSKKRAVAWLVILAGIAAGPLARAQQPDAAPEQPITVAPVKITAAPEAEGAAKALDEPGFVTSVDVRRDDAGSTAEVLGRSAGVSVRSLGGLGAFASISIRGAPSAETAVFVDGVPLSRVAFAGVDLGAFDLGTFDRVDVYRGGVPVALGGAALGGAVDFVTVVGPRPGEAPTRLVLSTGSYGARRALVTRRDRFGDYATTVAFGYAGADGDYTIFDDGGTPLEPSDDGERTRVNNGFDQLDVGVRGRRRGAGGSSIELGERVSWKTQGIPGPAGVMAEHTSLSGFRSVLDGRVSAPGALGQPRLALGGGAHLVVETQRYRDPDGEIGLASQDSSFLTVAAGATLGGSWAQSGAQLWSFSLEPRVEWFRENARTGPYEGAEGFRWGGAISLADTVAFGDDDRLLLVPALRADALLSRPSGGMGQQTTTPPAPRDDLYLSPRLGARVTVVPGLAVKGSAGRYFRPPTLTELYGDRGFLVGNPALEPETGWSADLGVVLAPAGAHGPLDRLYLESALFLSRPRQLIAWVPSSGRVAVARNLGDARLQGAELTVAARLWRRLTLAANYTYIDSAQDSPLVPYDGKDLPGRPRHELYARADLEWRRYAGFVDLGWTTGSFLDAGNLNQVPARKLWGAGVRVRVPGGVALSLEARNLLDERVEDIPLDPPPRPDLTSTPRAVSDALGYPLPGRSLLATVQWDF